MNTKRTCGEWFDDVDWADVAGRTMWIVMLLIFAGGGVLLSNWIHK